VLWILTYVRIRIRFFRQWLTKPTRNKFFSSVADPGCLSRIRLFSIPDPGSELSLSRILIKEFKYFNPQKSIPDPGVKKAPNPGSGSATLFFSKIFTTFLKVHLLKFHGKDSQTINVFLTFFLVNGRIQIQI
jgi:hypothetical protein